MPPTQQYVSNELTHFIGRSLRPDYDKQYELMVKIIKLGKLTHAPHNPNDVGAMGCLTVNPKALLSSNKMFSEPIICFCDIPLSSLEIHMAKYGQFGLAFRKPFLVAKGANPVFYIAGNSNVQLENMWPPIPREQSFDGKLDMYHRLSASLIELLREVKHEKARDCLFMLGQFQDFLDFQIFNFMKVFDDEKAENDPDNYYMEREWRLHGYVSFTLADVCRVILPKDYETAFRKDFPAYQGQVTLV